MKIKYWSKVPAQICTVPEALLKPDGRRDGFLFLEQVVWVSLFLQALWTSWSRKQLLSNVSAVSSGEITWLEARFMHQRMLFLQNTGLYHLLRRTLCNPNALIENCDIGSMFKESTELIAVNRSVTSLWLQVNDGCGWARWLFLCWKWLSVGYNPSKMFHFRVK